MKISRMFNIEVDIADKLKKEDNMSELVNSLLKKHYLEDVNQEELELQKAECLRNIEIQKRRLEKVEKELESWKSNKTKGVVVRYG